MKWRMKAAFGCALVAVVAGMAGCGGGDDGSAGSGGDPALVGNWKMTSMSVNHGGFFSPAAIGWDMQLQLGGDGTANLTEVWHGSTESSSGGWSASGNQLTLTVGSYNWTGTYAATANRFTLSNVPNYDGEGDAGAFVFTRQ